MLVKEQLKKLLLAIVPVVALTACQPNGAQQTATSAKLGLDTPVKGELTSASPMNMNDGSRYQLVSMRLTAGQTARISLEGALPGRITVFQDGTLVSTSKPMCCDEDTSRKLTYVIANSDVDTELLVGVNGLNADSFGPFTVRATASNVRTGGDLAINETVSGWLNGAQITDGTGGHSYQFTVTEAAPYVFTLRSSEFDAFLTLNGEQIEMSDDDSAGNSDARLTAYLEPGSYTLKASTWATRASGMYSLTSAKAEAQIMQDSEISVGHSGEAFLVGGSKDTYQLTVAQAGTYVFDLESDHFDAVLLVSGSGVEASDDDGGNNYNSRLELDLEPGVYNVTAGSMGESTGGVYRLSIQ